MKARIKFFSLYSDVVKELVYEDEEPICISTLMSRLINEYPALKKLFDEVKPIILVNGARVEPDHCVEGDAEIAFIPPASGG